MVIKLNIGGTLFVTSQATLMQFPTSVFGTIASGAWQPDYEGAFFFDRNPKYFEIILDAMRQKAMGQDCTLAPKYNTRAFRAELDFYQLSTLFGADEDEPVSPCSEDDPSTPSSKGSVISPSKTLPVLTLHYCIWSRSEVSISSSGRKAFSLVNGVSEASDRKDKATCGKGLKVLFCFLLAPAPRPALRRPQSCSPQPVAVHNQHKQQHNTAVWQRCTTGHTQ